MGIRFRCPNGHKLNVKSFLAGKRGICPHCGVKVEIPDPATAAARRRSPVTTVPAAGVAAESASAGPPAVKNGSHLHLPRPAGVDPIGEAPHAVWFVRPPTGGQFGPASGDVMRTWVLEGRVTADSLVWREGWSDWQPAGPLFPGIASVAPSTPVASAPQIVIENHRAALPPRRQNRNDLLLVVILLIACLLLFAALVYVVAYV